MLDAHDDPFSRIWTAFEAGRVLPACAWCGRVRIDEAWLVPPPAALVAIDRRYTFSHSICDRCVTASPPPSPVPRQNRPTRLS
jgi:hypothetical protein